ncbi:MAG: hypothetical protein ABI210_10210, partial [Abditibacteriaceae bacterium]
PYTHEEVASLISDGVNDYPLLNYTPINYSGKLMPLTAVQPLTVPDGDKKWGTRMATRGGMDLQIDVPEGLDTLPFRVDSYYDKTIALVDANGKELWKAKNTGIKEYETPKEFEIPIPGAGRYTIQLRTAGGLWFQTLKGLTLVFPGFLAEMGSPSPRVYFYVPSGVRTIAMYLPGGNHQGYYPQVVKDPDGKQVTTESHDAGTLVIVTVPEGQDGKVWSLEAVRTPDEPIRMLNVPNFFSLSPDSLMVPQDALK